MREYLADQLLLSAKRRGRIPDSAFASDELLQIANEQMETYLAPLILRAQEDYYQTDTYIQMTGGIAAGGALLDLLLDAPLFEVIPFTGTQLAFRVPSRAIGGALRNISFLDANAATISVPRISVDDLEQATWGVFLQSQLVTYVNRVARVGPVAIKLTYAVSPSLLCPALAAAVVTDIVGKVLTLAAITAPANPVTPAPTAALTAFASLTSFDFVKSSPGFEVVGFDKGGTFSGTTLTLDQDPPGTLEIGDYVAQAHYSPVPQCPTALWPLLAQAMAVECLTRLGDARADAELAKRDALAHSLIVLLQNRVKGAPQSRVPRHGILAATRRW